MSSEVEVLGAGVAAAVALPAAAVYGVGWLAWQSGRLLVEANRSVDRQIAEKKRQQAEAERHRKMAALSARGQLADMCSQIISKLDKDASTGSIMEFAEIEQLKYELQEFCNQSVPENVDELEGQVSRGYLKLEKITRAQEQLLSMGLEETKAGLYRGLSVADLMDDLRIAITAMSIRETKGADVKAADPIALERAKLNERFAEVTGQIMSDLEYVTELTTTYRLTEAGSAWFHSCFNGVDKTIENLCLPTTSNQELKKGIKRLEDVVENFRMLAPSIESDLQKREALYKVYVQASDALGEKILSIKHFKNAEEVETRLQELKKRAEKAEECAKIYQKLGGEAYLCYAWDQELRAMGYEVHTRKEVAEMANTKPERAKIGENKLPFYKWDEDDLTQLYSISEDCNLQVIIHEDGRVSMQTIAEESSDEVIATQKQHCSRMKELHQKLRENWFIFYDYEETESPEKIKTVAAWKNSENYAWKTDEMVVEQRTQEKKEERAKQMR